MVTKSIVWLVCLLCSVVLHAIILLAVGVKNGSYQGGQGKPFSLVSITASASAVKPDKAITFHAEADKVETVSELNVKRELDTRGVMPSKTWALTLEQPSLHVYKSSEVSHLAELQLPLEGVQFSDELALSGRLILDIAVSDRGKVINIDVVEASDPSGGLRAHMLPLLRDAPFSPAYKDGKAVNSVRRVEFTLGYVIHDPAWDIQYPELPGFRPRMDERGNILKDQPKP